MSTLVRLADVPAADRPDVWRTAASRTYAPLEIRLDDPARFRGRLRGQVFGEVVVGEVTADAHEASRTARLIGRADTEPHYKLTMAIRGRCVVAQQDRQALLGPGDLAVYDTSRPYSVVFEDTCRMVTAMVPRRSIPLSPDAVAGVTATVLSGQSGTGALLSGVLGGLLARLDEVGAAQAVRASDTLTGLLTTALAGRIGADGRDRHRSLLCRIKAFAAGHLGDSDLSPATIAAAAHVSTGYLHKLFRAEGTTASHWIRDLRLEHCRRDLADPALAGVPVRAIAARWGFVDAAHFSRLFKQAHGVSPREYRFSRPASPR